MRAMAVLQLPARANEATPLGNPVRNRMSGLFGFVPHRPARAGLASAVAHPKPAEEAEPAASGGNLPGSIRTRMETSFGADFGGVRVHEDGEAASHRALAFARGDDLHFAPNQYRPDSAAGQRLIAHELAHVVQQRNGSEMQQFAGRGSDGAGLEAEADRAADAAVTGARFDVRGVAGIHALQCSTRSDQVHAAADKGAVFTVLRASCPVPGDSWSPAGALTTDGDPDLTRELAAKLGHMPDDAWLATQIRHFGPEPLWPPAAIEERARRANAPGSFGGRAWAPEAGNIGVQMEIPDREPGEEHIPPVNVYFFPGRSGRRAMVVGGVHGTEHQGVAVVEQLRAQLAAGSAAGNPPFFSTVLVPMLIERSDQSAVTDSQHRVQDGTRRVTDGRRNVCGPGSSGVPDASHDAVGERCSDGTHAVEPNRTFPGVANPGNGAGGWGGQSYQDARRDGLKYQGAPNSPLTQPPAQRMIAETRALIALIERFQPERIASVHAHSVPGNRGDGPGIFVDPRGGVTDPAHPTESGAATATGQADDRLAQEMLTRAESDLSGAARSDGSASPFATRRLPRDVAPLAGNQLEGSDQVHYTANHPTGTSLGDLAPSRGITTVTVEVPQRVGGADLANIETMHRDLLERVFLADPSLVTPGAFGAAPAGLQGRSDAPAPTRAIVTSTPITQRLPPELVGPPQQVPAGVRVEIVSPPAGAQSAIRVLEGPMAGTTIQINAADLSNLRYVQ